MRLTDLEPRWFTLDGQTRVGLTFNCPHCGTQRLGIVFHHHGREAIENEAILARHGATDSNHIWDLIGPDDFATLTLSPSIDASTSGHWHGFVRDGEIK